jgi:hypothetical protein
VDCFLFIRLPIVIWNSLVCLLVFFFDIGLMVDGQQPRLNTSPEFIRHLITTFTLDVKIGNANLFQFTQQPQNNNYSKNYSQRTRNYFLLRLKKHSRHIGYNDKGAPHTDSISLDTPRYVTISGRQHIGLDHRCW